MRVANTVAPLAFDRIYGARRGATLLVMQRLGLRRPFGDISRPLPQSARAWPVHCLYATVAVSAACVGMRSCLRDQVT
jgi:hypothetical protein